MTPCRRGVRDKSMFPVIEPEPHLSALQSSNSQPPFQPGGLRSSWLFRPLQSAVKQLCALTLSRHSCHSDLICMAPKTPEQPGPGWHLATDHTGTAATPEPQFWRTGGSRSRQKWMRIASRERRKCWWTKCRAGVYCVPLFVWLGRGPEVEWMDSVFYG